MTEQSVSHREASELWNESAERANLLKGMPLAELVRRRFVAPAAGKSKAKAAKV